MPGFVTSEDAVDAVREDGDTAAVRLTIDGGSGSERLEQRVIRFAPGRSKPRTLDSAQQVLYVAAGRGALVVEGRAHDLEPDTGAYVAAGETFEIDNPGPEELVVVAVSLPQENGSQFLGVIDPSRVPAHGHNYDEVIYVVEGEGTLHLDGQSTPIAAGSCIHLPPQIAHCLENHGPGPMRVLGVFHPAGDPAGRAFEETK